MRNYDELLSHPVLGKSWEGYVIESIHAVLPKGAETYFYRTAAGAEVDLIIKMPNHTLWAVEIKYGTAPKVSKHYHRTCDELGVSKRVLIYGGEETFPVNHDVWMYSLPSFLEELAEIV